MANVTLEQAIQIAVGVMRKSTPIKTGNLRYNSLKVESLGGGTWRVFIDEDIAPYMPFTNEPWTSAKWHGAQNPNEGWWERAVEEFARSLAIALNGELEK